MTDIPIIFSAPMVRALLEGRKTMTRRILNPQPLAYKNEYCTRLRFFSRKGAERGDASPDLLSDGTCPASHFTPYQVGDRLWVRESWRTSYGWDWYSETLGRVPRPSDIAPGSIVEYLADDTHELSGKNWPSIFMPRWASRLTLIVTAAKVERLQDISGDDAVAEGIFAKLGPIGTLWRSGAFDREGEITALTATTCFRRLWESLHGADAWEANPWVVAPSFRVIKANIDAPEAMAA